MLLVLVHFLHALSHYTYSKMCQVFAQDKGCHSTVSVLRLCCYAKVLDFMIKKH